MKKVVRWIRTFIKKIFLLVFFIGAFVAVPILISTEYDDEYWTLNNNRSPVLTWSETGVNTSTAITVSWETHVESTSKIEFGTTPKFGDVLTNTTLERFHVMRLTDLKPDTRYFYKVGAMDRNIYRVSETYSFITAPIFGEPLHFAIYGDTRDVINGLQAVSNTMLAMDDDTNFVVHVGDLVGNGGHRGQWNQFFRRTDTLHASIPFVPVLGNHEWYGEDNADYADSDFPDLNKSLPEHYLKYFELPGNELYYSLNMSNLHYVVLDSNEPGGVFYRSTEINRNAQAQWLYDDLRAANGTYPWIFTSYHHPEKRTHNYTVNTVTGSRNMTINEIMAEGGVDAVVLGHYHSYERQWLTVAGRTIPYVINGGGGADLDGSLMWDPADDEENERTVVQYNAELQFLDVRIDRGNITLISYNQLGEIIDSFGGIDYTWEVD